MEDHAVTRIGTRHVLDTSSDFIVVSEADHSSQIPILLEESSPDFLLMDLKLPGENSLGQISQWKKTYPKLKIVILSMVEEEKTIRAMKDLGVDGYLLKSDNLTSITDNLLEISKGAKIFPKGIDLFTKDEETILPNEREKSILVLLGQGKNYSEIGTTLDLSKRTVEYHVGKLKDKYNCKTIAELILKVKANSWL